MYLRLALAFSWAMGHPLTILAMLLFMLGWLISGGLVGWSDNWKEVAGTGFESISVVMLFLLHADAVRENRAMQLKLDELLRMHPESNQRLRDIEHTSEAELRAHDQRE